MKRDASLSLRRYGESKGSHSHEHFQLLWGWQGSLELEIEGRGTRMTAGRRAVIAPGERHDFWSHQGSSCFVIDADDAASPVLAALAGRALDTDSSTLHLLRFLSTRHDIGELQGPAAAMLLATLPAEVAVPRSGRRIDWGSLEAWVDARVQEPIGVAQLAAQAFLSPSQFAARCVSETGLSPMAYVRARRHALALKLRSEGMGVQEVALRCGYRSPSALTAALRRRAP